MDILTGKSTGARRPAMVETGDRIAYGDPDYNAVMDFLIQEARMLDQYELAQWREHLAPEIFYYMSQRRTLARGGPALDTGSYWYYENIDTLDLRINKFLNAPSAFAEDPPSRIRRYVSNLTLFRSAEDNAFVAESYLQLLRNRDDSPTYETLSCLRKDVLRREGDKWLIVQRHIMVDQAVLGTHNISFFL